MEQDDMYNRLSESVSNEALQYKQAELSKNEEFIFASNKLYEKLNNKPYKGNNEDLVKYSFQTLSYMRDNTVGMAATLSQLDSLSDEEALTLHYLFKTADVTDEDNWQAVQRFAKSALLDPTTLGMVVAPFSFVAKKGAKEVAKRTIMKKLSEKLTPAIVASAEGAAYGAAAGHLDESVSQAAGNEYDTSVPLMYGAAGAAMGGGIVKGAEKAGKFISNTVKSGKEEMMKMAGGGTPPAEPFYSVMGEAIDKMPNKIKTEDFAKFLKKQGVKDDEIKFSGLDLNKHIITKQEAKDTFSKPKLQEKVLGTDANYLNQVEQEVTKIESEYGGTMMDVFSQAPKETQDKYNALLKEKKQLISEGVESETKFKGYTTEGVGDNYREEIVTLPKTDNNYNSAHWDEPNVLYHKRLQDTKIDNDKTLLVEEIQSDWHQAGRSKGYNTDLTESEKHFLERDKRRLPRLRETQAKARKEGNELQEVQISNQITDAEMNIQELESKQRNKIPQAPYAKTWHEKAMKDVINEAVTNGYDRVAWTVGKTQADRYSLAKQIDGLDVSKTNRGTYHLNALEKNSDTIKSVIARDIEEKDLQDYVGKDLAFKIINDNIKNNKKYTGLDLQVGGEGMKGFYDKILPDFTSKYIKKFNSSLEKKKLSNGDEVWSFKVTDKMREDLKKKGQPLYSVGGGLALGANNDDNEAKK